MCELDMRKNIVFKNALNTRVGLDGQIFSITFNDSSLSEYDVRSLNVEHTFFKFDLLSFLQLVGFYLFQFPLIFNKIGALKVKEGVWAKVQRR